MSGIKAGRPVPRCPLRPGDPCTLCQLDVTGPQDCGLVYLVMSDPEQREELHRFLAVATDGHTGHHSDPLQPVDEFADTA